MNQRDFYEQFDSQQLTDPATLARPSHPATSHEAAANIAEKITKREAFAINYLMMFPDCTSGELEAYAVCRDGVIRKRLAGLERKGKVERSASPRKCRVSGGNCHTWKLVGG